MNSEQTQDTVFDQRICFTQIPLFPYDPWGARFAFEVVENPAPGISRAMIGPMLLGDDLERSGIQCLAVTKDGNFAAAVWVSQPKLYNPELFWKKVEDDLVTARLRPISLEKSNLGFKSPDCPKKWQLPEFWGAKILYGGEFSRALHALSKLLTYQELGCDVHLDDNHFATISSNAMAMMCVQIESAVECVFNALEPGLRSVLVERPGLSISLAHQVLVLARQHSTNAYLFALQALRTESLGVLHLIASGPHNLEALQVMNALFDGRSVPDAFVDLGIAKAAYRRTLLMSIKGQSFSIEPVASIFNLPIAGRDWLAAMRLTSLQPFHQIADFFVFSRLLRQVQAMSFQQTESASRLLQWCVASGYATSSDRLCQLMDYVAELVSACLALTGLSVTVEYAILSTLNRVWDVTGRTRDGAYLIDELDACNDALMLVSISEVSRQSVEQLVQPFFDLHPKLSLSLSLPEGITLHELNNMETAIAHGLACSNCIQNQANVLGYVMEGTAMYGVRSDNKVIGILALRFDHTDQDPRVQVQEVTGFKNAPSNFDLCQLAQYVAGSWSEQEQNVLWAAYDIQTTRWRVGKCL